MYDLVTRNKKKNMSCIFLFKNILRSTSGFWRGKDGVSVNKEYLCVGRRWRVSGSP